MQPRSALIYIIKRLPFILSILLTPALLFWVLNYNPQLLDWLRFSSGSNDEPPATSEPEAPGPDLPSITESGARGSYPDATRSSGTDDLFPERSSQSRKTESESPLDRYLRESAEKKEAAARLPTAGDQEAEAGESRTVEDWLLLAHVAVDSKEEDRMIRFALKALDLEPYNDTARAMVEKVRYDPAAHLEEFTKFEGRQLEGFLREFKDKSLRNRRLSVRQMRKICEKWDQTRSRLEKELSLRKTDPHDAVRKTHMLRLTSKDDFRNLRYHVYRSHPNFRFFIEDGLLGNADPDLFSEEVANDLDHLRHTFETNFTPSGSGWRKGGSIYFVWMFCNYKSVRFTYNEAYDMLCIERPPERGGEAFDEGERRKLLREFCQLLLDDYCSSVKAKQGWAAWLWEGLPFLMNRGRGLDAQGRLNLFGCDAPVECALFSKWISTNRYRWPLSLEELISFIDLKELQHHCDTPKLKKNPTMLKMGRRNFCNAALEACQLFSLYLYEVGDPEKFNTLVRDLLLGKPQTAQLLAHLDGQSLEDVQKEIIRRYTSPEMVDHAIAAGALPPPEPEPVVFDPLDELVKPGMTAQTFQSLLVYLARSQGCFLANRTLTRALEAAEIPGDATGIAPWMDLLARTAEMEKSLRKRLAEKRMPIVVADEKLTITGAREGRIRCEHSRDKKTIELPGVALDAQKWVYLYKKKLNLKSSEDRLGYALLFLLEGDGANFKKEMKFIKEASQAKDALYEKASAFSCAADGADLISMVHGTDGGTDLDVFVALLEKLKDHDLISKLRPFIEPMVLSSLTEKYMAPGEGCYLATTFAGYQGADPETGEAVFLYSFDQERELADFGLLPHAVFDRFRNHEMPRKGTEPFKIEGGALSGYGTLSLTMKPRFDGPILLEVTYELVEHDKDAFLIQTGSPYLNIGYGLDSKDGYVCSSSFYNLYLQSKKTGDFKMYQGKRTQDPLLLSRPYITSLKGEPDMIILGLEGKNTIVLDKKGARAGQVFIHCHGPFTLRIHEIKVRGTVDDIWHRASIHSLVEKDAEEILKRLP